MSLIPAGRPITVYLVGDSTMSVKQTRYYPEAGWGMPFVYFFDEGVKVDNRAMNGRSTRTFIEEGRWQPVADSLREGDYVLIQFGHNDEVKTKKSYVDEAGFQQNLVRFIEETRAKKAYPVLITPVARRSFDADGKIQETHAVYAQLVRDVAAAQQAPLIDLDKTSQALLQKMGPENSKMLFLHMAPGEHPNYPEGKEDNTHFNELGARKMAELVLADLKAQKIGLADRVVKY
ncbi:rhamnogalacturonan acetylesterase [Dyadobacter beijingensis]|nr:rhamnogalacturonan acetylesterase [Dyadobacter beijingensis]